MEAAAVTVADMTAVTKIQIRISVPWKHLEEDVASLWATTTKDWTLSAAVGADDRPCHADGVRSWAHHTGTGCCVDEAGGITAD